MSDKEDFILQQQNKIEKLETKSRFSGEIGEKLHLIKEAIPHHDEFEESVAKPLKEYIDNRKDQNKFIVMEGGCGTGYTTDRILKVDDRIQIIAVDSEEKTLRQAKETFKDKKENIDFKQNDILSELEKAPDNSIDSFTSAHTIHNISANEREKIFREIFRVLKEGGVFINADKIAHDDEKMHKKSLEDQIKAFDVYDKTNLPQIKKEWTDHYYEDEEIKITESDYIEILKDIGFKNIRIIFRQGMEATITAEK